MKKVNLNENSSNEEIFNGFDLLFTRKTLKNYNQVKDVHAFNFLREQEIPIFHKDGEEYVNIDSVLKPQKGANEKSRSFTLALAMIDNHNKTLTPEAWSAILAKQSTSEPTNDQQNRFIGSHVKNVFSALKQSLPTLLGLTPEMTESLNRLLTPPIVKDSETAKVKK